MKRTSAMLGLMLLLLLPQGASAEHLEVLLDQVQAIVEEDAAPTPAVASFVAKTLNAATLTYIDPAKELALTQESVSAALALWKKGLPDEKLCAESGIITTWDCEKLMNEMKRLADREMSIVHLGHRIQAIATGYEQPVREFSIEPQRMNAAYEETLRVWGIPQLNQELRYTIRLMPIPDGISEQTDPLFSSLQALGQEQEIAAVWRYTYGVEHVDTASGGGNPASDTERQYLLKRWQDIESQLEAIRGELSAQVTPPLKPGEVAMFVIPLDGTGKANLSLWAYFRDTSKDAEANEETAAAPLRTAMPMIPAEDVGLRWDTALEPVFPSLQRESDGSAILGGRYPPAPSQTSEGALLAEEGGGLCQTLAGSQGYLCRGRSALSILEECQEEAPQPQSNTIILSSCTPKPEEVEKGLENVCAEMRKSLPEGTKACENGTHVTYPYSIMGDACFVRECAERTAEHDITPGRVPFVAQETAYPWSGCPLDPPAPRIIDSPPSGRFPVIPAYNPALRIKELDTAYCQGNGKPPLSPPVLCGPSLALAVSYPSIIDAAKGIKPTQDADVLVTDDTVEAIEAMGLERGTSLYRDYLRQASEILGGNLKSVVTMLRMLAQSDFPETMCPLNPYEDRSICSVKSQSSASSEP